MKSNRIAGATASEGSALAELYNIAEKVSIRKGIAGWHLVPLDPEHHPLLVRLYGHTDGNKLPSDEFGKALDWDSLEEGLRLIRGVAKAAHVTAVVCGNRRRSPTLVLKAQRRNALGQEPTQMVFEGPGLGRDAAKWGISDFYDGHARALRDALQSHAPFDTGWYGVRKEIQSGRVWRSRRNGPVCVEVSASMDDWPALVDTALWKASGKQLGAGSGHEVLTRLGLSEDAAYSWVETLADEQAQYTELEEDNSATSEGKLAWNVGYDTLCSKLDALMDKCEKTLAFEFEGLAHQCAERLVDLKRERGASCRNCRHFHAEVGATRSTPAEPADCGHPRYFALLSSNKHFPFEHGCKFWTATTRTK